MDEQQVLNTYFQWQSEYFDKLMKVAAADGSSAIKATDAATFLRRSGLSQKQLHKIWELAAFGQTALNREQFHHIAKLIAMEQQGINADMNRLTDITVFPRFGNIPMPLLPLTPDRIKLFDEYFVHADHNKDGWLSGSEAIAWFGKSKLEKDILAEIWNISDLDRDGRLSYGEFRISMHITWYVLAPSSQEVPLYLPAQIKDMALGYPFTAEHPAQKQQQQTTTTTTSSKSNAVQRTPSQKFETISQYEQSGYKAVESVMWEQPSNLTDSFVDFGSSLEAYGLYPPDFTPQKIPSLTARDYEFVEYRYEGFRHGEYTTAQQLENRWKNRYSNVLPNEEHRVRLTPLPGKPGSDYINASWVDGEIPNRKKKFIATQGPTDATIPDFWRMVWETNACVILMLTKEVEAGRLKCATYWPQFGNPLTCESLTISAINESSTPNLIERKFVITDHTTGMQRNITQLHYIAWPDHGVPQTPEDFVDLAGRADRDNHTHGPIVAHCSAGIGRTGTFCLIQNILEKYKYDLTHGPGQAQINVVRSLFKLRTQRPGMIQTKDQYDFCFVVIAMAIRK